MLNGPRDVLALWLTPGVGPRTFYRLLHRFGSASQVFGASTIELQEAGAPGPTAARLAKGLDPGPAETQLEGAARLGGRVVTWEDADYPAPLRELEDPPPVLWAKGRLPGAESQRVAIVGTRAPDAYGHTQALRLADGCARAGCWVISGGARGIDTAAHEGALGAGGPTLVVLGSGLDEPYPAENRKLFERIAGSGGGLVSEFRLGTTPTAGLFPRRNRLVAALGQALVVVQAARRSGSLLTAGMARRLERPVLAVPGPIDRPASGGPHLLLREGAGLCERAEDVLAAVTGQRMPGEEAPGEEPGEEAQRILAMLAGGPLAFDEIARRADLAVAQAAELLLSLELAGLVEVSQGFYRKKD